MLITKVYNLQEKYEQAIQNCEFYMSKYPDYPDDGFVFLHLGESYVRLGDIRKAQEHFQWALDMGTARNKQSVIKEAEKLLQAIDQSSSAATK